MFKELIAHAKNAISRGDMGASMAAERAFRYSLNMRPKSNGPVEIESSLLASHEEICHGIDALICKERTNILQELEKPQA